jgi:flagellar basal body rod protein FlgG
MNVSVYQAASALNANARWQQSIAENMAASSIPGFKKQVSSFNSVSSALHSAVMPSLRGTTWFQQAEIKFTGVPTDLAIEGDGFFEVQLPNGDTGYTRNGEFHISAQGQLVTRQGYAVLSRSGPIQIDFNNPAPLTIAPDGTVSQGADIKGQVKVTRFEQPDLLQPTSSGFFLALSHDARPTDATDARLHQGSLENANTTAVVEMAQLLTAMRQFEASQRVLQMQDERMGRLISELGNPT